MLKTLTIAFAAAALVCSQTFAADYTYKATDKTEQDVLAEITSSATPVSSIELADGSVLTVQASPDTPSTSFAPLNQRNLEVNSGTATLCVDSTIDGRHNTTYYNSLTLAESGATLVIDLSANSLQAFEDNYMGGGFNDIYVLTIVLTPENGIVGSEHITLSTNAITALGGMGFSYIGYTSDTNMFTEALSEDGILKAGEVALMDKEGISDGLFLVGKKGAAPATPEPATATLSLLALAGLASRRRRK